MTKKMQWIPAIDLKAGQVVRLKQGRMDDATVYSDNPVEMAKRWIDCGTTRLHVVDLDGAFLGSPVNLAVIEKIAALSKTLHVQVGGGIRNAQTIQTYLNAGVRFCILGTVAIKDRQTTESLLTQFKGSVILGIDAKDGRVAGEGWAEASDLTASDVAKTYEAFSPEAIIYTDISRDGMLSGPNLPVTLALAQATTTPVIVSGGISSLDDLRAIVRLNDSGITGAILGKSLYENRFTLEEAFSETTYR